MRIRGERVEVQLFIDGKLVGTQVAHLSRPDVLAAGWSKDEWHGYNFIVPGLIPECMRRECMRCIRVATARVTRCRCWEIRSGLRSE